MTEYFIKLNKYQKGMIISLLILSLSLIGFMFNSRVRLSEPHDKVPEIIIEETIDIDPEDSESSIKYSEVFKIIMLIMFPYVLYKICKEIWLI